VAAADLLTPAAKAILADLIPDVAKRRHKFVPVPPLEDLEADLWLAACEDSGRVNALAGEDARAGIELLLSRAARRVQLAEEREYRARRAYALGYAPADEQFYSLGALRALLPAYLDGGVSEHPPKKRDGSGPVRPGGGAEYGDWQVMMMDVQSGLAALPPWQRRLLTDYFTYPQGSGGWTHLEISSAMREEPEALRVRVYRALKALQDRLGGASPYIAA
jgi:DNA-directed RNA polymerase specialized sigma24 family protein